MNAVRGVEIPAHLEHYVLDMPAASGKSVLEGHANVCRLIGHATNTVDGILQADCARCGEYDVFATCRWFALCDRKATAAIYHPILGNVPTCDRCADLANA